MVAVDEHLGLDVACVGWPACEDVEQRRLAAARGAHEGADFAWPEVLVYQDCLVGRG